MPRNGPQDDDVTVVPPAEVDVATAPALAAGLRAAAAGRSPRVVVDLSDTTFIDSAGMAVLVEAADALRAQDRVLDLRDPPPMLRRMAAVLGTAGALGLQPSR